VRPSPFHPLSLILAAAVTLAFSGCSSACLSPGPAGLVVMSYNVDNLFDASDSGSEYPEYSVAAGRWDETRYRGRLSSLAEVVRAASPATKGADIACFMEVENRAILEELRRGALASSGYRVSCLVAVPGQAANCGILSRLPLVALHAHGLKAGNREGRYILEARFDVWGRALTVFVCHWKSKLEGAGLTEGERRAAAALVAGRVAEILRADPAAEVLVCGDFNEGPDEFDLVGRAYATALVPTEAKDEVKALCDLDGSTLLLVAADRGAAGLDAEGNPALWSPWPESGGWSYAYGEKRERIDGFLLSPGLLDGEGLSYEAFAPLAEPFLLGPDGLPRAYEPRTGSGHSDHLPLVLRLSLRKPSGG
jgi:endonuclease/exonuclease/phosphatase family metal-dependent hydrolase